MIKKTWITLLFSFFSILLFNSGFAAKLTPAQEASNVVKIMTLDEKIGQMTQVDRQFLVSPEDIKTYFLGSILSGGGSCPPETNSPQAWADMVDSFQRLAQKTRLGIPLLYGSDAVHGHNNVYGAVILPHNIGMGGVNDIELYEQGVRMTAEEALGTGVNWSFSPCVAVAQDKRWGRTYESFSDRTEVVSRFARATVLGFQTTNLGYRESVLACAKHYVADGGTADGIDRGDTVMSEADLRAIHLPPYKAAIDAGVMSIMASFSSWNGQKMHSSEYLLTQVLKKELGFGGFVVSDWKALEHLPGTYDEQLISAINAGVDMVMVPDNYKRFIATMKRLVATKKISESRINDAVYRILKVKFEMKLFERASVNRILTARIGSAEHRKIARELVQKSVIMIKNGGAFPFNTNMTELLVAGKNADDMGNQCGGWSITWQGSSGQTTLGTTILDGVKENLTSKTRLTVYQGGDVPHSTQFFGSPALVVIGETPYAEYSGDREDLSLDPKDVQLVKKIKQAGYHVTLLLVTGRPLDLKPIMGDCDVILCAWLPGTEGNGVTDVLFGKVPLTGQNSHRWPAH